MPGREWYAPCWQARLESALFKDGPGETPTKTLQTQKVGVLAPGMEKYLTSKTVSRITHLRAFQKDVRAEKAEEVWV